MIESKGISLFHKSPGRRIRYHPSSIGQESRMTLDGFVHRVMYVNRPRLRKRTTKVPLRKTRFIDVPLRRVAVDLVGPTQPATNKGKRNILIAVDYAARFH